VSLGAGSLFKMLALLSNVSGTFQLGGMFLSLFKTSDTDKILNTIMELQKDLARDFKELGDLIGQQIHLVIDSEPGCNSIGIIAVRQNGRSGAVRPNSVKKRSPPIDSVLAVSKAALSLRARKS
jgi:hypothetical protein